MTETPAPETLVSTEVERPEDNQWNGPQPEGALAEMAACPNCGRMVRVQHMDEHRRNVHGLSAANQSATSHDTEMTWTRVLAWLRENPGKTQTEIRTELGMTIKAASNRLIYLADKKKVVTRDYDGRYWPLTPEPEAATPEKSKKPYKKKRTKCPDCGRMILSMNIKRHLRTVHGQDIPKADRGQQPSTETLSTVTVAEVVETIVSIRFPDRVPTNLLAQVLELENVIRRFLEQP